MKEYIAEYIVPVVPADEKGKNLKFDFMNAKRLIRCRDCKHFTRVDTWQVTKTETQSALSCTHGLSIDPNGYCHRAERNRNDE